MRRELVKSQVVFNQAEHTYTLNGKQLSGITGMLGRQLFPGKYTGVPKAIMEHATERGNFIHEVCELIDDLGVENECEEAKKYQEMKDTHGLVYEASEYLVSDNEMFASCIDKVFRDGDSSFTLGDIKTTYKLDVEFVRWQLSIYAYLFEMQNPGCSVTRLVAIWLRGDKSKMVVVERIPNQAVISLLEAEAEGRQFVNPLSLPSQPNASLPQKLKEMEDEIVAIDAAYRKYERMLKDIKEAVMKEMVKSGDYSWNGERISFTRKKESVRKSFDTKSFSKDYPELYEKYMKESPVAGSLTIKVNQ